jgi:hypothetical protein
MQQVFITYFHIEKTIWKMSSMSNRLARNPENNWNLQRKYEFNIALFQSSATIDILKNVCLSSFSMKLLFQIGDFSKNED